MRRSSRRSNAEIESTLDAQYAQLASAMIPQADKYLAAAWEYEHYTGGAQRPPLADFAKQRGLRAYELGQWARFVASPQLDLMTTPAKLATPGLYGWRNKANADAPVVVINTTDQPVSELATLVFPPKTVNVHPSPSAGVAVSWKSPITGRVKLAGKVTDGHAVCGDGIAWSISSAGGKAPGRSRRAPSPTAVPGVRRRHGRSEAGVAGRRRGRDDPARGPAEGRLLVRHDARRAGDCGTGGTSRAWNLEKDATKSANGTNPLADRSATRRRGTSTI
jgi:hypothetical protein